MAAPVRVAPWVELRSAARHPFIYRKMIASSSPDAAPGDLVAVYDRHGERFGSGFYNPRSTIALRMLCFDETPVDESFFRARLEDAVSLRHDVLGLPDTTDAYRVVHSEGDGVSGLVVDRYADVLCVQAYSRGVYRVLGLCLPILDELLGTGRRVVGMDPQTAKLEDFRPPPPVADDVVRGVRITENGVRFSVDFESGHKTGFFCDQRDNRARLARLAAGLTVLDLCCYTGGFALAARVAGDSGECTGVDLDEAAIAQARRNANLNQTRVKWVHADAFSYARQMQENRRQWDIVVLDPPKFISSRGELEEGRRRYHDLNRLAVSLVKRGGVMVTCSCSGLLQEAEFERLVAEASRRQGRSLQFFDRTGAGPDHPVMANCPESRYLNVLWARVL